MKDSNERMKTDLDTMMELYWSVLLPVQPFAALLDV
jgi:hypothetical protein